MTKSRISLADLSPKHQAEAAKQLGVQVAPEGAVKAMAHLTGPGGYGYYGKGVPGPAPKKRLRQSTKPLMNKLEARFMEHLQLNPSTEGPILPQAVRLELARGIWYKPDFFCPGTGISFPTFYEVKGPKAFRGGFENLKVAARVHRWAKFYLVWWNKDLADWTHQEVLG